MSSVEEEILQLKSYFKHHRIITYATLGFLSLFTLVSIVSFQSLNSDNQYTTSSSAEEASSCPYKVELRGTNQCPVGLYRYANIQCYSSSPPKVYYGETLCGSACCSADQITKKAAIICGCVATPTPTPMPTDMIPPPTGLGIPAGCRPVSGDCNKSRSRCSDPQETCNLIGNNQYVCCRPPDRDMGQQG